MIIGRTGSVVIPSCGGFSVSSGTIILSGTHFSLAKSPNISKNILKKKSLPKQIGKKKQKKMERKTNILEKQRKISIFFEIFQKKENIVLKICRGNANIPTVALRGALTAPRFICSLVIFRLLQPQVAVNQIRHFDYVVKITFARPGRPRRYRLKDQRFSLIFATVGCC